MRYSLNFQALRKKAKLTQAQLADKVGVEQPTIGRWEKGERKPDLEDLDKLAVALGVHPGELFADTELSDQPHTTASALTELAEAALRHGGGKVSASSVRPIVRGLTRGLELLIRNPAIRTNREALALAVQAIESPTPDTSSPA
jgi:transcriptional regulator with XRE-family HTH domain